MTSIMSIDNIPWHRLTTAYGKGTEIPALIEAKQYHRLTNLIEHQSTLWQVTPWVLLILLNRLAEQPSEQLSMEELHLYKTVASVIPLEEMNPERAVASLDELLDERYLWPLDEEESEWEWEKDEPRGYDSQAFLSYYYFSYILLCEAIPLFKTLMTHHPEQRELLEELVGLLQPEG